MDTFIVRIVKCNKETYWYKNKIGAVFIVDLDPLESSTWREESYTVSVMERYHSGKLIKISDCEVIEEL